MLIFIDALTGLDGLTVLKYVEATSWIDLLLSYKNIIKKGSLFVTGIVLSK